MSQKNIKILIVDDTEVNIKVLEMFLKPRGYEVVTAEDGQIAIEKFVSDKPDIILMDVMMPNVDGYDATIAIRGLAGKTWVPILFLSAKASSEDIVKGIEIGGDDYLTKPVNLNLLEAKLGAMIRIVNMQKELAATHQILKKYHDQAAQELDLANELMQNMARNSENQSDDFVRIHSQTLEEISGDITITYRTENDNVYLLMADATGHGLAAAISQIPATQIFYQMAEEGYSVSAIVRNINQTLSKLLPADRFVTATIAYISPENRLVEIWNGSNPAPVFFNKKGSLLKSFEKTNFALGIVDNNLLDSKTEVYIWPEDGELLAFTDGIVDLRNDQGDLYGAEGIAKAMSQLNDVVPGDHRRGFDFVIEHANEYCEQGRRDDDVSLVSIECT